jgi:hypothetical protein
MVRWTPAQAKLARPCLKNKTQTKELGGWGTAQVVAHMREAPRFNPPYCQNNFFFCLLWLLCRKWTVVRQSGVEAGERAKVYQRLPGEK